MNVVDHSGLARFGTEGVDLETRESPAGPFVVRWGLLVFALPNVALARGRGGLIWTGVLLVPATLMISPVAQE
jgi:hypothetical protein